MTTATPEPRVLLLSGSPRTGGNTDTVLATIAAVLAEREIPATTVRLCDIELNPCTGCELCRKTGTCSRFDDEMTALYPEIERCAGLVLASPTYNYTVTPQVKSFIDRLYPYFEFTEPRPGPYKARLARQGRQLLPVGICEQNEASEMRYTIPVMRDALEVMGYEIVHELALTGHFYRGTVATDRPATARIRAAAEKTGRRDHTGGIDRGPDAFNQAESSLRRTPAPADWKTAASDRKSRLGATSTKNSRKIVQNQDAQRNRQACSLRRTQYRLRHRLRHRHAPQGTTSRIHRSQTSRATPRRSVGYRSGGYPRQERYTDFPRSNHIPP